jgi:hypothetical protein
VIAQGRVFVWCDEAGVHEVVPPVRWRRTFMVKRALLRGAVSLLHPTFGVRDVARSVLAVGAYTVVLPVALLLGQAAFMTYLVKLSDHLGRLLALAGIRLIRRPYITE